MRVKLSYTAEVEEILPEVSFLLNRVGPVFLESLENFQQIVNELQKKEANLPQTLENIDKLRLDLGKVDLRLVEAAEILAAFEHHRITQRAPHPGAPASPRPELLADDEGDPHD
jgi:hypothetical protein